MTFGELQKHLSSLNQEQLDQDVVVHDMVEDEFFGSGAEITFEIAGDEHDVLDPGHPIICLRK